jgi:hypothetical protein
MAAEVIRKLEDFPTITRQWEHYVETHWWPWALEDRRLEAVQSVYNQLFAVYQMQPCIVSIPEQIVVQSYSLSRSAGSLVRNRLARAF